MSVEEGNIAEMPEGQTEESMEHEKEASESSRKSNGNLVMENGSVDGNLCLSDSHDQLRQMVIELQFQNEYLKSQFECLKNFQDVDGVSDGQEQESVQESVKELQARIESLNTQLLEEKQTRRAAEEALKHLTSSYSEADKKAQELTAKLITGQILFFHK